MKKQCPRCDTIVETAPGAAPVCPTCGFGAPPATATGTTQDRLTALFGEGSVARVAAWVTRVRWQRVTFADRVLNFAAEGRVFSKVTAWTLRAAAALVVFSGVVAWFWLGGFVFSDEATTGSGGGLGSVIGGILFLAAALVAIYLVTHILVIRARHVESLPHEEFTVIPIAALMVRTLGEVVASVLAVVVGIGAGLMTVFSGLPAGAAGVAGPLLGGAQGGFLLGLGLVLAGLLAAVVVLAVFYLFAEAMVVAVAIAKHGARTNEVLDHMAVSNATQESAEAIAGQVLLPAETGRR